MIFAHVDLLSPEARCPAMARQSWHLSSYTGGFCGVCAILACYSRAVTHGDAMWSALLTFFCVVLATWAYGRWFVKQTEGFSPQKRELNKDYCLVDEQGNCRPFSDTSYISQQSGEMYEKAISTIFNSNGPWMLHATTTQDQKEKNRLNKSKNMIADFLRKNVFDRAGAGMQKKGTGSEQAEVDTVYNGSFKAFAESISQLSKVMVQATCKKVEKVLVECCSDCRFVAMKLYQIEIQSCLLARGGGLTRDGDKMRVDLQPETTGFAIIFNRAALQCNVPKLAKDLNLANFLQLLETGKLHIAYFQSEAALPAALSMARDADQKASDADQKARDADQKARDADQKARDADQKARDADQKARDADQKARDADQKASEASQKVRELEDKLRGDGPFSVSSLCFSDCFVGMSFKCIFFSQQNLEYMQHSIS